MDYANLTTLAYLFKDDKCLMLHRIKKNLDVNAGKWVGVGGHFKLGEMPEECLRREVKEETGLELQSWEWHGVITFNSKGWPDEYIFLYSSKSFTGELKACDEGELAWIPQKDLLKLNLWPGDRIFLKLMLAKHSPFSLKLSYEGDDLIEARLNGELIEL